MQQYKGYLERIQGEFTSSLLSNPFHVEITLILPPMTSEEFKYLKELLNHQAEILISE